MGLLTFFEDGVEKAFGKIFPVSRNLRIHDLARLVCREAEKHKTRQNSRTVIPHRIRIRLSPETLGQIGIRRGTDNAARADAPTLRAEAEIHIKQALSAMIQTRGYAVDQPIDVGITADADIPAATLQIIVGDAPIPAPVKPAPAPRPAQPGKPLIPPKVQPEPKPEPVKSLFRKKEPEPAPEPAGPPRKPLFRRVAETSTRNPEKRLPPQGIAKDTIAMATIAKGAIADKTPPKAAMLSKTGKEQKSGADGKEPSGAAAGCLQWGMRKVFLVPDAPPARPWSLPPGVSIIGKKQAVIGRAFGRGGPFDIEIEDTAVSGKKPHAVITVDQNGACTISDHHSANGTLVNDRPITATPLKNNDRITIGRTTITFTITPVP